MKKQENSLEEKSKEFCLGIDDFGFLMPNFDIILRLKKTYPDLKLTLFTIALPEQLLIKENLRHFTEEKYKKWAKMINSYDWIQIAPHGLYHTEKEMMGGYTESEEIVKAIENVFKRVGLKYVKIFKAPHWQYSWFALKLLRDRGYTVALNRNEPIEVPKGLKTFYYNWSFEEPIPHTQKVIGHGHLYKCRSKNDIESYFGNLLKIPSNAKFSFI